jgi:hypothetical protein
MAARVAVFAIALAGCTPTVTTTSTSTTTGSGSTTATGTPVSTTTTAVPTTTTTEPSVELSQIDLLGDGIGIASFGEDPETVITAVSQVLGPPDSDTGFVDTQVLAFCGDGLQRTVSWGDLHLGFVDREYEGYAGFIAYAASAIEFIDDGFVTSEEPWPVATLPNDIGLLDTASDAAAVYGEDLSRVADYPFSEEGRLAYLDLSGPWEVFLWLDEPDTDRITRITGGACGD